MSTKSFLKNINIKEKRRVGNLVRALEKAENFHGEPVVMTRASQEVKGDNVKKFLANYQWN